MKALVYEKPGRANGAIREIEKPVCGPEEVLIKVMACAICKPAESSHDRESGSLLGVYPATPGHEFSGVVEEAGERVTNVRVGDRVVADNAYSCGTCHFCQMGQPEMCTDYRCQGHNMQGGFAQYMKAHASKVHAFSEAVSYDSACVAELINCATSAVENAELRYGDSVVIIGCGSSGHLIAQLVKHSNAGRVVALDTVPSKLDRISGYGVETLLVDPEDYGRHETALKEWFPHGIDVVIDAAGDDGEMLERMLPLLAPYGRLVLYSFFYFEPKEFHVPPGLMIKKGLKITSAPLRQHNFGKVVALLEEGTVDTRNLITHTFALEDYFQALDVALQDREAMKVIIHPNGSEI